MTKRVQRRADCPVHGPEAQEPVHTGIPDWALGCRAENDQLRAAVLRLPPGECPRCRTTLPSPRSVCPSCKRRDWCLICGELLIRASTRRCERCGEVTACPFCGAELKSDPYAACPLCKAAVQCRACGYTLTGNASGRCPECGADATPRVIAAGVWPPQTDAERRVDSFVSGAMVLLLQLIAGLLMLGLAAAVVGGLLVLLSL